MGGKGGGGGEARWHRPACIVQRHYTSALCTHTPKVCLLPDLFDLEKTARQSSPVSRLGLSPSTSQTFH